MQCCVSARGLICFPDLAWIGRSDGLIACVAYFAAVTARKSKQLVERMAEATPRRKRRKPHPPSKAEEYLVAENSTAAEALMALLRENTRDPQKSM